MEIIIKTPELEIFPDAKYERKPGGVFVVDGVERAFSLQCPHCGAHFVSMRGSGARRAWCYPCHAVTCGNPDCDACVPWEKKMEAIERAAAIAARG